MAPWPYSDGDREVINMLPESLTQIYYVVPFLVSSV